MTTDRDLVHLFSENAASIQFDALPLDARDAAKKSILDTIGVILAGSGMEPSALALVDIVEESGGRPDCTVLGTRLRAPALMAALANGAMAHGLDYDDQTPWGQHCASSIVPAVLALAERSGAVSGKDIITAVALGQDLFARLRRNVEWKKDWNLSTVLAVFAATLSAGRSLNMPADRIANAIGIASMQSSGIMEMVAGRGSDLRGLYAGFSAKGAVLATLMAERGVTGIDRMFEGQYGFFATYFPGGYDRAAMLSGLGEDFMGSGTLYKRWPCVGTAHSHIKAAIDIVSENGLNPGDIAEVKLHVGDYHELMCRPLDERRTPATLVDAKFSLPYLVAVAIARKGMALSDFTEAALTDETVREVGRKISLVIDPALDWKLELPPGRVEIIAADGRSWLVEGRRVPGNADNPMDWEAVSSKFAECASMAARPPSQDQVARTIELASKLEDLTDGTELVRALSEA